MSILIIDKSDEARSQMRFLLNLGGYFDLVFTSSIEEAFNIIDPDNRLHAMDPLTASTEPKKKPGRQAAKEEDYYVKIDIIIFDIFMPDASGIEACYKIKSIPHLRDIPLIAVTENLSIEDMLLAFEAGVSDYISKPLENKIELIPRVSSALKLKHEMEIRKAREKELMRMTTLLEESNKKLSDLASIDGLTRVANRRHFNSFFSTEWKRALRLDNPLAILMADIDYFKPFNDIYGHQKGDDCLIQFANALKNSVSRPCDIVARYGGEEFIILLTDTDMEGAKTVAGKLFNSVRSLAIPHEGSPVASVITFSLGMTACIPSDKTPTDKIIATADTALYNAKKNGRNQFCSLPIPPRT